MTPHERIELLIPWYVNGTLPEGEMDLVNAHLGGCDACRRCLDEEVRFARRLRARPAGTRQLPEVSAAWERVVVHLPRAAAPPRFARAAVAGILTLLLGSALLVTGAWQRPAFQTLTAPADHPGPVIQVMFQPDVSEQQVAEVVSEMSAVFLPAPAVAGVQRLALPTGSDGSAQLERLRRLPGVRWAELEVP